MEDYYAKYAKPLESTDVNSLKARLSQWRNGLKEEYDGLSYLRATINKDSSIGIDSKLKSKITDLINKLETVITKEMESIRAFQFELQRNRTQSLDDKVYTKVEIIRDNYNKIILNIQKMISSSPIAERYKPEAKKNSSKPIIQSNIKESKKEGGLTKAKEAHDNPYMSVEEELKESKEIASSKLNSAFSSYIQGHQSELNNTKNTKLNDLSNTLNPQSESYTVDKELQAIEKKLSSKENTLNSIKTNKQTPKQPQNPKHNSKRTQASSSKAREDMSSKYNTVLTELKYVKDFCEAIDRHISSNCLMEGERNTFLALKNDYMQAKSDLKIMKEDFSEILLGYSKALKRLEAIEEENRNLRKHNQNLVKVVQKFLPSGHDRSHLEDFNGDRPDSRLIEERTLPSRLPNERSLRDRKPILSEASEGPHFKAIMNKTDGDLNPKRRFLIPKRDL